MEYTDIIPKTYVTKSAVGEATSGSGSYSGVIENIYDGSTTTYYQYQIYHEGDGDATGTLTFDAVWVKPIRIHRVYVYSTQGTYGGNYKQSNMTFRIFLRIGGTWTMINEWVINEAGFGSNVWAWRTYERNLTTGWDNVTGTRHYMYGYSYSYEGDRRQYTTHRMHEVQSYREKYTEAFRLRKSTTTAIIGKWETLTGNKLRIRKGGITYSIPLLDTDDPTASPVRVYSGAAVKSLPLAD